MKNLQLKFKSEEPTQKDQVALMLLGGDCGSDIDGVDWSDGINQDEVNLIDQAFNQAGNNDDFDNPYIHFNEDGTVSMENGNAGSSQWGDSRKTQSEWNEWKRENGYQ